MAKQYAVLHTEKGKGVGGGMGHHIDRTPGMAHTYPHADPTMTKENINYTSDKYKSLTVPQAIEQRIKEGYKGKKQLRSDAVKYLSTVLTGTHEQMQEMFYGKNSSPDPVAWIKANMKFAEEEFGKENIIRFVLHLDEKTPHLHVVHVPLTKDGRLSAKEVMGDRTVLKDRQTRYAEMMGQFGLERGEERQGVHHEKAQEYYRRINIAEDFTKNLDANALLGMNKDETIEKLKKSLKQLKFEQIQYNNSLSIKDKEISNLRTQNDRRGISLGEITNMIMDNGEELKNLRDGLLAVKEKSEAAELEANNNRGMRR